MNIPLTSPFELWNFSSSTVLTLFCPSLYGFIYIFSLSVTFLPSHLLLLLLSCFSRVWLFATLWTIARQAPLSTGFPRQEYWSGTPCPPLDPPHPGTEPTFPFLHSQVSSLPLAPPRKPLYKCNIIHYSSPSSYFHYVQWILFC